MDYWTYVEEFFDGESIDSIALHLDRFDEPLITMVSLIECENSDALYQYLDGRPLLMEEEIASINWLIDRGVEQFAAIDAFACYRFGAYAFNFEKPCYSEVVAFKIKKQYPYLAKICA